MVNRMRSASEKPARRRRHPGRLRHPGLLSAALAVSCFLIVILTMGAAPAVASSSGSPAFERAPINPEFVERALMRETLQARPGDPEWHPTGYIPSPVLIPSDGATLKAQGALSYPASYDLRSLGRVTGVRDQNPYGTCWAFATIGSLESALMPASWDFSEDNVVNGNGYSGITYDSGGWTEVALAYLARWGGPVEETSDPYPSPGVLDLPPVKHVQSALRLPGRSGPLDNDALKDAVMTIGGVQTSFWWDGAYYSSATHSYYYDGAGHNHAVVIVGWDDTYRRDNFNSTPAGDGAFIVRNSWGQSFGEGGYFYVSYYDTTFAYSASWAFPAAEPANNYSTIYQYDPLGWTSGLGYGSNTAWFANRFTAANSDGISAVAFYAATPESSYEVWGGLDTGDPGPGAGELTQLATGTLTHAGYHTIALAQPLSVTTGAPFCVAVRLTTPGYNYPVALEAPVTMASPTASANQSFVSWNESSWTDLTSLVSNGNVCLKAFTGGGYILTVNKVGSGTVVPTPDQASYASGTVVSLKATPAIGWKFDGWSGDAGGATNPVNVTMNSDKTVTATFTELPAGTTYTLTANVVGSGTVARSPDKAEYLPGEEVTLTATPASGWEFGGWSGDAGGATNPVTITMDADKTVTATFALPSVLTRYEQNHHLLRYQGTWATLSGSYYSGGSYAYTKTVGSSLKVTFYGTSIDYIARKSSNQGSAQITLDGVSQGTVSLYNSTTRYKQTVWGVSGLSAGIHTLIITCPSTKYINVDAFDIRGTLLSET